MVMTNDFTAEEVGYIEAWEERVKRITDDRLWREFNVRVDPKFGNNNLRNMVAEVLREELKKRGWL
jgi:hypothetical protein